MPKIPSRYESLWVIQGWRIKLQVDFQKVFITGKANFSLIVTKITCPCEMLNDHERRIVQHLVDFIEHIEHENLNRLVINKYKWTRN